MEGEDGLPRGVVGVFEGHAALCGRRAVTVEEGREVDVGSAGSVDVEGDGFGDIAL